MRVVSIPAFDDNYIFALAIVSGGPAVLVDPGEAAPALEFLERECLSLEAILVTHHHGDHVGGIEAIVRRHPGLRVVGAARDAARIPGLSERVGEGDVVPILGRGARVIEVPGHTLGHVAYFVPDAAGGGDLFSGDTVFGGTIGNLFEGTADDVYGALVKLRALPPATRIWCAHEYTLQYVREAARFEPDHPRLAARLLRLEAEAGRPTVPLSLEEECATNPFFRWDDPVLLHRLGMPAGPAAFRRLCELL
jgi:hydroxyacylglutathione hydrolase